MTPDGHQVRLETGPVDSTHNSLTFILRGTVNLQNSAAPHMRRVFIEFRDHDHFAEKWTKTENGKDVVFDLNFVRH